MKTHLVIDSDWNGKLKKWDWIMGIWRFETIEGKWYFFAKYINIWWFVIEQKTEIAEVIDPSEIEIELIN